MSEQNTLHWRLKLKTGDSVLWYPHGIVNLVDQPVLRSLPSAHKHFHTHQEAVEWLEARVQS